MKTLLCLPPLQKHMIISFSEAFTACTKLETLETKSTSLQIASCTIKSVPF